MSEEPFKFNHHFRFIWHTSWMEPCWKCHSLNGRTFTDQDLFQHTLWDTIFGDLWDLDNDVPLIHPNCKCYLEVLYESTLDELLNPSKQTTFTRYGEEVTAYRSISTGRFTKADPFKEFGIMTSNIKEMKAEIKDFESDLDRANSKIENTRAQLITYLMLLQRAGLPPEVEKAISILVRARMTAEMATRALYLMMAASGPMGWALAIASGGVAVMGAAGMAQTAQDLVMDIGGT